jgi:predicted PurR-regulated permease PerM
MLRTLSAIAKTVLVVVLAGATLIASFYFAYVLIVVLVLGGVGAIAYLYFNREEKEPDWFDFTN